MLVQEKVKQAVEILKEFNIDCWLTFVRETALNGDPILDFIAGADVTWHSAFIISQSGETRAIVGKYDQKTIEDAGAYKNVVSYVEGAKEPLLSYLKEINPKQIAINYSKGSEICDGLTHGMYLTLQDWLAEIGFQDRLISSEKIVSAVRERKSKTEIAFIKKAIEHTENIFAKVAQFILPGKSEIEIADFITNERKRLGLESAWEQSTCPAVFTGPDTAGAHYTPTNRKVERGHVLNMDFGLRYKGYCSDLQRAFYVLRDGETAAPREVQKGFDTIVRSIDLAKEAMKPGVQGIEVDTEARTHITKNGYQEFPHALGHQVGRFPHDGTALLGPAWEKYDNKPFEKLEKGMVFTIEPRLTVPGYGVVTIENMVVVTSDGAEYLSTPQAELLLI
ncbi:MAG TPA: Xaa-Pro peptidase family protein [bacterium]